MFDSFTTGIAGCVIKDEVTLGTSRNHKWITIGAKAVILGQTGVTKSVEGSLILNPIEESREKLKQLAKIKKIPEILNKLK
jgi:UDP-3-O-[3-hydroxymyristoyl] glucosamine N-acyltransferase